MALEEGLQETRRMSDLVECLTGAAIDLADVLPHAVSDRGTYVRTLVRATPHVDEKSKN